MKLQLIALTIVILSMASWFDMARLYPNGVIYGSGGLENTSFQKPANLTKARGHT